MNQTDTSPARRRMRGSAAVALALATSLAGACTWGSPGGLVVGSGDVTSQTRSIADFTEVEAGGGIQVELATGARQVVVTAQPNILDITTTEVAGSRLTISTTSGYVSPRGVVVQVTLPRLTGLELSGGASASGAAGTVDDLKVVMSGGARTTLTGTTEALGLEASGGAIVDLGDLTVTDAAVDLSGGVVATLDVRGSLTGSASGGVVLNLDRRPASSDVETSGGAVVRQS